MEKYSNAIMRFTCIPTFFLDNISWNIVSEVEWSIERKNRGKTICMWQRERKRGRERKGRKVGIGKIESMKAWKKKMEKYKEN